MTKYEQDKIYTIMSDGKVFELEDFIRKIVRDELMRIGNNCISPIYTKEDKK